MLLSRYHVVGEPEVPDALQERAHQLGQARIAGDADLVVAVSAATDRGDYTAAFGTSLCITDSYRSLGAQIAAALAVGAAFAPTANWRVTPRAWSSAPSRTSSPSSSLSQWSPAPSPSCR